MTTVVGVFDRTLQAEDAIRELQRAGVEANNISLVAQGHGAGAPGDVTDTAAGVTAGAALGGIAGLLLGVAAFAIPGIGPVVAAGPIAAALGVGGVGAVAGGILGALTGMHVPEDDAKYYAEQVRRGGALVVVHARDAAEGQRARQVMDRAGAASPGTSEADVHRDELAASSRPNEPQLTASGSRLYDVAGLEFDPRTSRMEDFGKK